MNRQQKQLLITVLVIALLFYVDPVFAGPGGTIAKSLFKTWWGKLLLFALIIIFLPLIIYAQVIEFFAVKKCKKQLTQIGLKNKDFSWLNLEKNVSNILTRVYLAWNNENMKEVQQYVNHWYWQNQKTVHLDKWKSQNLKNVCNLESIYKIKPLYIEISSEDNYEGSKIAFSIDANVEDYLVNRDTRKVVEGKKGFEHDEKIWILEYSEGKWLLDDIRDGKLSLAFAKLENVIPEFSTKTNLTRA